MSWGMAPYIMESAEKEFEVGDRVVARIILDSHNQITSIGTIIKVDIYDGRVLAAVVECDNPIIFPNKCTGHGAEMFGVKGKDGHCWYCKISGLERLVLEPYNQSSLHPGYQRTSDGFLTNPDNWQPGKWLI